MKADFSVNDSTASHLILAICWRWILKQLSRSRDSGATSRAPIVCLALSLNKLIFSAQYRPAKRTLADTFGHPNWDKTWSSISACISSPRDAAGDLRAADPTDYKWIQITVHFLDRDHKSHVWTLIELAALFCAPDNIDCHLLMTIRLRHCNNLRDKHNLSPIGFDLNSISLIDLARPLFAFAVGQQMQLLWPTRSRSRVSVWRHMMLNIVV